MALPRALIPIPLGRGLDNKTDPKQVQIGKLAVLENAVFTKVERVGPRYGLTALGSNVLGSTSQIGSARELAAFKSELNLIDSNQFYTYSPASDAWLAKAPVAGAKAQSSSIVRNTYEQLNADSAIGTGYILYAWEDSSGGVRASIYDQASNQPLVNNALISATGSRPKASAAGNYLYVHYMDAGNTLKCARYNPGTPTAFEASVTLASNAHGTFPYLDVAVHGSNLVLAYRTSTPSIRVGFIRADGNFAGAIDGFPVPVTSAQDPSSCLAVYSYFQSDPTNDAIYVLFHDTTNGVRALIFNPQLSNAPSPIVVEAILTVVRNIGITSIAANQIKAWYEVDAGSTYNRYIKSNTLTKAGVAGTASVFLRSVGLHSKPFVYNSKNYMIVSFESTLQSTYFTVTDAGLIVNRISSANGAGNTNKAACLCKVSAYSSKVFIVPTGVKGPLRSEGGQIFSVRGLQATRLDFDDTKLFRSAVLGSNSHISAGMLLSYDGINLCESGFNVYPEGATSTAQDGVGGSLVAGTRQTCYLYEWTDQQGQIHRSAPSIPISTTTAGGASKINNVIPTLRLTSKTNVSVVVYRTVAAGTTFYRASSVTSPLLNDKTVDTVTYLDNTTDAAIISNEILYTTGGKVANFPPPSASFLVTYQNRIFLIGLEDENSIRYSKSYTLGEGVSFNDGFELRIDQGLEGARAGGVLDEKLILFKGNSIWVTAGLGPLDTGASDDLQDPQLVTSDVGISEPKSLVKTPIGLMFKSSKGYYLLDRSLQTAYIGAAVEDFNGLTVTSATLLEDVNQVRFTHSDGSAVIYDYFFNQWAVFTNYKAVAATSWNGSYIIARDSGTVYKEDKTSFLDQGVPVKLKLRTSWISTNTLQGFQRIYRALFLGDYLSKHLFVVRIGYDFEAHFREQYQIDTEAVIGSNTYGQGSYYGSDTFIGGVLRGNEQFEVRPARQKCEAIRFEIEILNPTGFNGGGAAMSQLVLEIGQKMGKGQSVGAGATA